MRIPHEFSSRGRERSCCRSGWDTNPRSHHRIERALIAQTRPWSRHLPAWKSHRSPSPGPPRGFSLWDRSLCPWKPSPGCGIPAWCPGDAAPLGRSWDQPGGPGPWGCSLSEGAVLGPGRAREGQKPGTAKWELTPPAPATRDCPLSPACPQSRNLPLGKGLDTLGEGSEMLLKHRAVTFYQINK